LTLLFVYAMGSRPTKYRRIAKRENLDCYFSVKNVYYIRFKLKKN